MGVSTALTALLGIEHPVMCAGMGGITGAELAAAVSNAGGIGTLGAIGLNPKGKAVQVLSCTALLVDALLDVHGHMERTFHRRHAGQAAIRCPKTTGCSSRPSCSPRRVRCELCDALGGVRCRV